MAAMACPMSFIIGLRWNISSRSPSMYTKTPTRSVFRSIPVLIFSNTSCSPFMKMRMITVATATPANIASPPNLGMGFVCIRRSSFGISITPSLGASHSVSGVMTSDIRNATPNTSQNLILKGIALSFSCFLHILLLICHIPVYYTTFMAFCIPVMYFSLTCAILYA